MSLKDKILRAIAVRSGVRHGQRFHVGPGSTIWAPRELVIGDNVYVGKHVTIEVDGAIGDETLIANAVGIVGRLDHDYRQVGVPVRSSNWVGTHYAELSKPVLIGSDVWIGYGAIILSGVTIGDSSIVAAGALVTRNIPANSIAAGSPAEVIRNRFTSSDFADHWETLAARGLRRMADA